MKYEYKTVTGKHEIEVDEQFFLILDAMDNEEHNSDRRYTRNNPISLCDSDHEAEWLKAKTDVLDDLIQAEGRERLYAALAQLTLGQQRLIERLCLNNEKITEIAQALGVSQSAISQQIAAIRCKIVKYL